MSSQAHFGSTVDLWGGRQGRSAGETQAPQAAAEMVQGRDDVGLGQKIHRGCKGGGQT